MDEARVTWLAMLALWAAAGIVGLLVDEWFKRWLRGVLFFVNPDMRAWAFAHAGAIGYLDEFDQLSAKTILWRVAMWPLLLLSVLILRVFLGIERRHHMREVRAGKWERDDTGESWVPVVRAVAPLAVTAVRCACPMCGTVALRRLTPPNGNTVGCATCGTPFIVPDANGRMPGDP